MILQCPQCRGENIGVTLIGCMQYADRNTATCMKCNWSGTVEDWLEIARLRRVVRIFDALGHRPDYALRISEECFNAYLRATDGPQV